MYLYATHLIYTNEDATNQPDKNTQCAQFSQSFYRVPNEITVENGEKKSVSNKKVETIPHKMVHLEFHIEVMAAKTMSQFKPQHLPSMS